MTLLTEFPTYATLLSIVEKEVDVEGEVFIQPEEMLSYANKAVDQAEKIVHGLYEDYFLDRDSVTLVSGTEEYVLPSRIYAHKIRSVIYRSGSKVYEVKRERDWKKFMRYEVQASAGNTGSMQYCYFILNQTAGSPKFLFNPTPNESGDYIKVWFIRQANRFVDATDVLDIPEAKNYIIQYMKTQVYEKDGHPNLAKAINDLEKEKMELEGVLTAMVPDADNSIEMDLSHYEEMS